MQPALSQVCTLSSSLEEDIDACADAAGGALELWLTKLEDYVQTHPSSEVKTRAADRGVVLAAASFQGDCCCPRGTLDEPPGRNSNGVWTSARPSAFRRW
ncbi:MAG: hypothetical protein ACKV0T_22710 [Planctomycetales bacterium]